MDSLDYVPIGPKITISISNGINLTFNIIATLSLTMDTLNLYNNGLKSTLMIV
jgi:hypothetical protein